MRRWPERAAIGLVIVLCASFALTRLAEVDLHWHLLAGETILDDGRVPREDRFTFTSAGRPWVDLHWLFQASIAAVHRLAGWRGLDVLKVILVTAGFSLAAAAARRRGGPPFVVAGLLLLCLLAAQERFALRPEAATFCLLGGLLLLLEWRRARPRSLLLAPLLIVLWANVHALYAAGLATVVLAALGDLLEGRRIPPAAAGARPPLPDAPPPPRLLLACVLASLLSTLATPYGLAALDLPRRLLLERIASDSLFARGIAEFQPPFGGFGPTTSVAAFGVLIVLVVAAAFLGWRRARPADLLLLAALLPLALLARRNIPLFALVALPAASPMVQEALRRAGAWMGGRLPAARALGPAAASAAAAAFVAACALLLLLDVWSNRFHARDGTHRQFGLGEAPGLYPGGAARFVAERRPPGEVFNDMTSGGYLAWRWFPDRRVFIDGRLEVHDEALFAEYLRAQRDPRFFEEMARRRDVRLVVWSHRQSVEAAPLLRHLATDPGWRLVFLDRSSTVFVRHDRAAEASLGLAAIDPGDPGLGRRVLEEIGQAEREALRDDPAPALLRRALPLLAVPMMEVNAGLLFGVLGHTGPAEALFRAAIDRAPRNATLRYDLGLVLETAGRREEARGAFEAALGLDPGFAAARGALGLALLRDGDEPGALEQWRLAERSGGDLGAAVLRARGALHARRGRVDEAIEDYRRAIRSDPRSPALSAEIALLYHRRGLNDRATAEIRRALALDPGAVPPRVALARMREAEGDLTGAERLLRDLVASHPGSPEARLGLAAILAARGRRDESLAECAAAIAAGLDPADLSREPALRILAGTPEYRRLIGGAAAPPPKERR